MPSKSPLTEFSTPPTSSQELVIQLVKQVQQQAEIIKQFEQKVIQLESRIKELEANNKSDSNTSSKPPSSDGYKKKKKTINSRVKTGKKTGGQPGHKGSTLKMSDTPDEIIEEYPESCKKCNDFLKCKATMEFERRQVVDIEKPVIKTTEYRCFKSVCPNSEEKITVNFPMQAAAPVSYGPFLRSMILYLKDYQFLPYERCAEFFNEIFGLPISQGTIALIEQRISKNLEGYYKSLKEQAMNAEVLHSDETGLRMNGNLHWLLLYSNINFTYYGFHKHRGTEAIDEIGILTFFHGLLCHDFFSSYMGLPCEHSMCNSHLLRELKAMKELYQQDWAPEVISVIMDLKKKTEASENDRVSEYIFRNRKKKYFSILEGAKTQNPIPEKIPKARGRPYKGKVRCLIDRLCEHADDILRFAIDPRAPFCNNLAERDVRMMKVKQKISGCFRSNEGAKRFCIIRSYLSTIRKQGRNVFQAIQEAISEKPVFTT